MFYLLRFFFGCNLSYTALKYRLNFTVTKLFRYLLILSQFFSFIFEDALFAEFELIHKVKTHIYINEKVKDLSNMA